MGIRLEDQQMIALLKARLAASVKRVESGDSKAQKDEQGNVIPSPSNLPPNAFRELMPPSQTFGEGDG